VLGIWKRKQRDPAINLKNFGLVGLLGGLFQWRDGANTRASSSITTNRWDITLSHLLTF
jgi:hypothetical protein